MKFALMMLMTVGLWAQIGGAPAPVPVPALTDTQKQAINQKLQAMANDTKAQSEKLSVKVTAIAKDIDRNLLTATPDEQIDRKLSADFATAVGDMVNAAVASKLAAVREIVKVLTPEQKAVLLAEVEKPGANPDLAELIGKVFGSGK